MSKKTFWILFGILAGLIVGVGIACIVLFAVPKKVLVSTPSSISFTGANAGNNVYMQIAPVDGAKEYKIVLENNSNGEKVEFTSANNHIDITTYVETPGVYQVKAKAIGNENESEFSRYQLLSRVVKIKKPEVVLSGNLIRWQTVSFATHYEIQLIGYGNIESISPFEVAATNLDTQSISITTTFSSALISGQDYYVIVKAVYKGNEFEGFILDSDASQPISYRAP